MKNVPYIYAIFTYIKHSYSLYYTKQWRMDKVENENVELRKVLDAAIGVGTDDKHTTGTLWSIDLLGNGLKIQIRFDTL